MFSRRRKHALSRNRSLSSGNRRRALSRGLENLEDRRLLAVSFGPVGQLGGPGVLSNPTSLEFGPDNRLYVAQQNGTIKAFTINSSGGKYVPTAEETLTLPGGAEVVNSIANHDDDGNRPSKTSRQVTGLVAAGTAANPVLYVSSSDPRISNTGDKNLDTNSGVITRVTWTGSQWETLDLVRGLPRSEENHSNNGMLLSADGTKLLIAVGGNTNNGAPGHSTFRTRASMRCPEPFSRSTWSTSTVAPRSLIQTRARGPRAPRCRGYMSMTCRLWTTLPCRMMVCGKMPMAWTSPALGAEMTA